MTLIYREGRIEIWAVNERWGVDFTFTALLTAATLAYARRSAWPSR